MLVYLHALLYVISARGIVLLWKPIFEGRKTITFPAVVHSVAIPTFFLLVDVISVVF